MTRHRRLRGFTLIELIVAMTLFALLLSVLMPALQQGLAGLGSSQERGRALAIASSLLATHSVDAGQPLPEAPLAGSVGEFRYEIVREPYTEDAIGTIDPELLLTPMRVSAVVSWEDGDKQISLSTLSLDPAAER